MPDFMEPADSLYENASLGILSKLPRELRDHIYEEVIRDMPGLHAQKDTKCRALVLSAPKKWCAPLEEETTQCISNWLPPSLARVSRQVRNELLLLFYNHDFIIQVPDLEPMAFVLKVFYEWNKTQPLSARLPNLEIAFPDRGRWSLPVADYEYCESTRFIDDLVEVAENYGHRWPREVIYTGPQSRGERLDLPGTRNAEAQFLNWFADVVFAARKRNHGALKSLGWRRWRYIPAPVYDDRLKVYVAVKGASLADGQVA